MKGEQFPKNNWTHTNLKGAYNKEEPHPLTGGTRFLFPSPITLREASYGEG